MRSSTVNSSTQDLILNYVPLSGQAQRLRYLLEYSIGALKDPKRADYVAAVGDLSSTHVLKDIRRKMITHPVGK